MLAGTSRDREEIVGSMRPTHYREAWQFTVEKVAVNAVMAGARPGYLPVILALAASGFSARISSTSSMAAMAVVNGPIRNEIGMNSGLGALGPYNHANATIGRAYGLLSQNLQGGSVLGETYMGCQGNSYAYNSLTFAENEEASPWRPYHVRRGFSPGDSAVTSFQVWVNVWTEGLRDAWEEKVASMLAGWSVPRHRVAARLARARQFVSSASCCRGPESMGSRAARIPASLYWEQYTSKTSCARTPTSAWSRSRRMRRQLGTSCSWSSRRRRSRSSSSAVSNAQWSAFMGGPLDARLRNKPTTAYRLS